ncbi:hypothetical protein VAE130_550484 [Vibrio aestuarianus]|nr:hypothetical protein VAE308_1010477 [Vibrio aestuarianus]CAH8189154.1 hypothetical protein VAE130_550484 [Vibrio aestuarianus]
MEKKPFLVLMLKKVNIKSLGIMNNDEKQTVSTTIIPIQ